MHLTDLFHSPECPSTLIHHAVCEDILPLLRNTVTGLGRVCKFPNSILRDFGPKRSFVEFKPVLLVALKLDSLKVEVKKMSFHVEGITEHVQKVFFFLRILAGYYEGIQIKKVFYNCPCSKPPHPHPQTCLGMFWFYSSRLYLSTPKSQSIPLLCPSPCQPQVCSLYL